MTQLELGTLLETAIADLGYLSISNQTNLPNTTIQQAQVHGMDLARKAAVQLAKIPGLEEFAGVFLNNPIVKRSVQDTYTYQDQKNGAAFGGLIAARDLLREAARVLRKYIGATVPTVDGPGFAVRFLGSPTLAELADRIQQVREACDESMRIAVVGGLVDEPPELHAVAAENGSIVLEFGTHLAEAGAAVKLLFWVVKQSLVVREQKIKQDGEIEKNRRLGFEADALADLRRLQKKSTDLLVQSLAKRVKLKKPLEPEEQRRLEKLIRDSARMILKDVQILDTQALDDDKAPLKEADYAEIAGVAFRELEPGDEAKDGDV